MCPKPDFSQLSTEELLLGFKRAAKEDSPLLDSFEAELLKRIPNKEKTPWQLLEDACHDGNDYDAINRSHPLAGDHPAHRD